jgi:hypothetical protein
VCRQRAFADISSTQMAKRDRNMRNHKAVWVQQTSQRPEEMTEEVSMTSPQSVSSRTSYGATRA